jgi:Cys-rich four helix bundle protein (predicted Tat secretion target)
MERRDFLAKSAIGVAGILAAKVAFAEEDHSAHNHGKEKKPVETRKMSKELKKSLEATFKCLQDAYACIAQCTNVLQSGDTSMADCQRTVLNMVTVCEAFTKLGTYNTADEKQIKALAALCSTICKECEKACEPHAKHHTECKNCMNSCKDCAKACDAYAKA